MDFDRTVDISMLPKANIGRSVFDRSRSKYLTMNAGSFVPIYYDEILPGDSIEITTSFVARLQTLIAPIMSEVFLDVYFFYTPTRLLWTHFEEFMGANKSSYWTQPTEYVEPSVPFRQGSTHTDRFASKSVADYFGYPTLTPFYNSPSVLPFRNYCLTWNEFIRDQNTQDPILIDFGDSSNPLTNVTDLDSMANQLNYAQFGIMHPLPANKYHDLFTSALPGPQKGPDSSIPIAGISPVIALRDSWSDEVLKGGYTSSNASRTQINPVIMKTFSGNSATNTAAITTSQNIGVNSSGQLSRESGSTTMGTSTGHPVFANLGVDLGDNVSATINDLRLSFATQRFYEALARSGSRYTELLQGIFGVASPDARLQRPEYLGGMHTVINVDQVANTNGDGTAPLGDVGAYSLTYDKQFTVQKSFVEHGELVGYAVIRYPHDYQNGLARCFAHRDKFSYYFPQFASIGEVGIKSSEIYVDGSSADDNIFGYQEAWYDYRFPPTYSNVAGEMRSNYPTSLDIWHLADDYTTRPTLSGSWIAEDRSNLDRVLAVKSDVADQALVNFYFDVKHTRPLPAYSIPGGLDLR